MKFYVDRVSEDQEQSRKLLPEQGTPSSDDRAAVRGPEGKTWGADLNQTGWERGKSGCSTAKLKEVLREQEEKTLVASQALKLLLDEEVSEKKVRDKRNRVVHLNVKSTVA